MSFFSQITPQALDVLCPMHLIVSPTGHIQHFGPTLRKLRSDAQLDGKRFLEVFEIRRPRVMTSMSDLARAAGQKLHLELREPPRCGLKGVLMPLPDNQGFIVNLSFGISVLDAVRDFHLTGADFAATDLTIEMLYLIEAKSSAMEASRKLNQRLQGAKIAAEEQAFTDTLTGLKNRRALDHVLGRLIAAGNPLSLMHVDLDFFKAVNDTLGHAAGDKVLLNVARVMIEATRPEDTVARVGGDEFVIILPNALSRDELAKIGKRVIAGLEKPVMHEKQPCKISGSIGTVSWDGTGETSIEALMDDADVALYASKHAGRRTQTFYDPALRDKPENLSAPTGRPEGEERRTG